MQIDRGNSHQVPQTTDESIYQRMGLGFAFLFTVRGLPVLYYGDEIGLAGVKDPDNRRAMIFEDGELAAAQLNLRTLVASLLHARNAYPSLRTGKYDAFHGEYSCLAYLKSLGTERVLVVLAGHEGCNAMVTMKEGYGFQDGQQLTDILSGTETAVITSGQIDLSLDPWSIRLFHMDTAN